MKQRRWLNWLLLVLFVLAEAGCALYLVDASDVIL